MKVLYHANCNDGSGAALAAWMHLGDKTSTDEDIEYIPVQYGSEPPDVSNQEVFILDFSYPRDTICEMATIANRITVIDHHKTAEVDLSKPFPDMYGQVPLCDVRANFDMGMSGAVLTWAFFHSGPVPDLLLYIQDRDLWRWELKDTKAILSGLNLISDWRDWEKFILKPALLDTLQVGGEAINLYLHIQSDKITETEPQLWDIEPDVIPIYNLPGFMISDTLHMALEKYPSARYAVGYFDLPGKRIYSLRSRQGSEVDVSEIAKRHGGGGHKHAAGFSV